MSSGYLKMAFGRFGADLTDVPGRDEAVSWQRYQLGRRTAPDVRRRHRRRLGRIRPPRLTSDYSQRIMYLSAIDLVQDSASEFPRNEKRGYHILLWLPCSAIIRIPPITDFSAVS
jgi:hypothetical protein